MVKRVLLAALCSAVLMFLWGFLFWGLLNMGSLLMQPLPAELDVLASLRGSQAPSGMYVYPAPQGMNDAEKMEEFTRQHREGPLLQLAYRAEGSEPMPPAVLALGFGHYFVVALLTATMVACGGKGLTCFLSRFMSVMTMVVAATIWANAGDAIWWFHSPRYCLGNSIYQLVAGALMAAVVAAVVKPQGTAE